MTNLESSNDAAECFVAFGVVGERRVGVDPVKFNLRCARLFLETQPNTGDVESDTPTSCKPTTYRLPSCLDFMVFLSCLAVRAWLHSVQPHSRLAIVLVEMCGSFGGAGLC